MISKLCGTLESLRSSKRSWSATGAPQQWNQNVWGLEPGNSILFWGEVQGISGWPRVWGPLAKVEKWAFGQWISLIRAQEQFFTLSQTQNTYSSPFHLPSASSLQMTPRQRRASRATHPKYQNSKQKSSSGNCICSTLSFKKCLKPSLYLLLATTSRSGYYYEAQFTESKIKHKKSSTLNFNQVADWHLTLASRVPEWMPFSWTVRL